MIRMNARGRVTGLDRAAQIALVAVVLAACSRSGPAPVEYRPIVGATAVAHVQASPMPPRPDAKPTTAVTPEPMPAQEADRALARHGPAPVRMAALQPSAPPAAVAPPPQVKPPRRLALAASEADRRPAAMVLPLPRRQALFAWPVSGRLLSGFGAKAGGLRNDGINIAAAEGTPVKAAEAGVVAYVGNELRGFGNLVLLRHGDGWMTAYAHVEQVRVTPGQLVQRGEVVARVGRSGQVDEPQLHFEIRKGRSAVDPTRYLTPDGDGGPDRAVSRAAPPSGRPGPG